MKSLTDHGLQNGTALIYDSPLASTTASLSFPFSTPEAKEIKTLILAYLNQWGFFLSAYTRLYDIQSILAKTNDQIDPDNAAQDPTGPWPLTEYDYVSAHHAVDIRDYVYILVISMSSILDFYICLIDAVRKKKAPSDRSIIGLAQFRNNFVANKPNSPFSFLDKTATPLPDLVAEIRHRIVHRGYSIRTHHSFTKEADLPIVLFQGDNYKEESYNFSVGHLFEDFYTTLSHFEQKAASVLPTVQPVLLKTRKISVTYRLDGDASIVEFDNPAATVV